MSEQPDLKDIAGALGAIVQALEGILAKAEELQNDSRRAQAKALEHLSGMEEHLGEIAKRLKKRP